MFVTDSLFNLQSVNCTAGKVILYSYMHNIIEILEQFLMGVLMKDWKAPETHQTQHRPLRQGRRRTPLHYTNLPKFCPLVGLWVCKLCPNAITFTQRFTYCRGSPVILSSEK